MTLSIAFTALAVILLYTLFSKKHVYSELSIMSVILAFILYICSEVGITIIYSQFIIGLISKKSVFSFLCHKQFAYIVATIGTYILLRLFIAIHPLSTQHIIWGKSFTWKEKLIKLSQGLVYGVFGYPIVMLIVNIVHKALLLLGIFPIGEQLAVRELKGVENIPALFWTLGTTMCLVVPIVEEIIFRGFLQNYLKACFSHSKAIFITAAIFTLFHFSTLQKSANIEILLGLFTFAVLISYAYAKKGSLYIPIGMHIAFNTMSFILLAIQ